MRTLFPSVLLLMSSLLLCPQPGSAQTAPQPASPTEISADLGTCSALINVTGADSKPIYSAKVSTRVRYGFMGTKRIDLETYTSTNGQAKIVGLPEVPKKPVFIYVSKGDKMEIVEFKPDVHCRATFDVQLK